jgi:uncharacterized GH25 family protein
MKRTLLLLLLLLPGSFWLLAHEFWIEPGKTHVAVGEAVPLSVFVGENFMGETWGGNGRRITQYQHFSRAGVEDLLPSLSQKDTVVTLPDFVPTAAGTHLLAFATNNSYIELEPDKFEAYLKEDGLDNALAYRKEHGEQTRNGREAYRRCAKVLIQAGNSPDATYREPGGMTLDILPLKNPARVKAEGGTLRFQVNYEEKALAGALVRLWYKDSASPTQVFLQRSSAEGEVSFTAQGQGLYMVSVVKMTRLENDPKADWQSVWGSLVFGL